MWLVRVAKRLVSEMTDYDYEAVNGLTPAAQAGLLMQRYLYEYRRAAQRLW